MIRRVGNNRSARAMPTLECCFLFGKRDSRISSEGVDVKFKNTLLKPAKASRKLSKTAHPTNSALGELIFTRFDFKFDPNAKYKNRSLIQKITSRILKSQIN